MTLRLQGFIYVPVPAHLSRQIRLVNDDGEHYINVYNIVLVVRSHDFTTFYIIDNLKPEGTRRIIVKPHLGSFIEELGQGFCQPNQSQLFNRLYLSGKENCCIQLHYPQNLPLIPINRHYSASLNKRLNNPKL